MSTNVLVVPDMAERTTILGWSSEINFATSWIRCAEPTEVPPNFNTFISLLFLNHLFLYMKKARVFTQAFFDSFLTTVR